MYSRGDVQQRSVNGNRTKCPPSTRIDCRPIPILVRQRLPFGQIHREVHPAYSVDLHADAAHRPTLRREGIYVRRDVFEGLPDTPRNRALIGHAAEAAARYRNVGVRIEDDYVLTPEGLVRITNVPREIEEIEALRERVIS